MPIMLSRLKRYELTVWMLVLAAYAHIWLGTVSGIHQAKLVRSDLSGFIVICTQFGLRQAPLSEQDEGTRKPLLLVGCPACAVASMPATASPPVQPTAVRQDTLVTQVASVLPVADPLAPPILRPPTRAPPTFS
jgi:hypothetical protein